MDDCNIQFWWDWWVNLAVALGTFAAVFVALFGDWLKARLFKPELHLEIENSNGVSTPFNLISDGNSRTEDGRIYHVRVSNNKSWPAATQVQVNLLRIEELGPDREFQQKWVGQVPLRWSLQEIKPLTQTIGPSMLLDLCSVIKNKWIELHPLITPNNLTDLIKRREKVDMILTIQAQSAEADSAQSRIQISWDGQWEDGEVEMAKHLKIKQL